MAFFHLQHSYQAEALSQLRPHNPPVWLRMLALNGEGSIKALHLSHQSFRRILRIFWPNVISNKDLFERCGTEPMATILMRRRWKWIGHVTRQEASIANTAMHWTPEGKRKRGRPKITWRRTVEKEIKEMGNTWEGIKFMAKDRQMWREYVAALHAS